MTEKSSSTDADRSTRRFDRRRLIREGGLLVGGVAAGSVVLGGASSAGAQTVDFTYLPIGPARVFDSRTPGGGGPLGRGQTAGLATGFQNQTPVPIAVTLNVTVTNTVGKGWLAVYPSNVTFGGTSSVNWSADLQDVANNAYVAVAPDGIVMLTTGGIDGSGTDFVIDIIGASAGVDYSSALAQGFTSALTALWSRT